MNLVMASSQAAGGFCCWCCGCWRGGLGVRTKRVKGICVRVTQVRVFSIARVVSVRVRIVFLIIGHVVGFLLGSL
jgi:hypothetical protein